jgi:hypothetical protein
VTSVIRLLRLIHGLDIVGRVEPRLPESHQHEEGADAGLELLRDERRLVRERLDPGADLPHARLGSLTRLLIRLLVLEPRDQFLGLGFQRLDLGAFLFGERRRRRAAPAAGLG